MRFDRKGPIYIPVTESAGGGLGNKEKKDTRSKKKSTQKQKSRLEYLKAQKEQEREKKMKNVQLEDNAEKTILTFLEENCKNWDCKTESEKAMWLEATLDELAHDIAEQVFDDSAHCGIEILRSHESWTGRLCVTLKKGVDYMWV